LTNGVENECRDVQHEKDAHITKKTLVEAAIEKVKEQITTHGASKTSTGASVVYGGTEEDVTGGGRRRIY